MADEDVLIEGTHGPYAGKRLAVSAAEAKKAIAEGWARDPFAEPIEAKELSEDERFKLLEKAEAGARRLRGEDPSTGSGQEKTVEAEKPAGYQTRDVKAKGDK